MKNSAKIWVLTFIGFFIGTAQFGISGILDTVAAYANVSLATAGQLVTAYAVASAIMPPILLMLTHKWSMKKQLLGSMVLLLAGAAFTIVGQNYGMLLVGRLFLGAGNGFYIANAYTAAAKLAKPGGEASAIANVASGYSAALVLGVPLGRIVAQYMFWKVTYWGIAAFFVVGTIVLARMEIHTGDEQKMPLAKQLKFLFTTPQVILSMCITLLVFFGYSGVYTYISPLLLSIFDHTNVNVSTILLLLGIMSLVGSKTGGVMADKYGVVRVLTGVITLQAIALLMANILYNQAIGCVICLMVWMMVVWAFVSPQNMRYVLIAPQASSILISFNASFVQMGFASGAAVGGFVLNSFPIQRIFFLGAAAAVIGLILLLGLEKQRRKQNPESDL